MDINITLIGQMITFAIFVWFTMAFVWPPLRTAMRQRQDKISEGLASADRAEKELEVAKRKANTVVQEAKAEATKLIEQANKRALRIDEEAKETARADAERIRQEAEKEIEQKKQAVKDQLRKEVSILAISGAEKLLKHNVDASANQQVLDDVMEKL